jgi:hypothetical protein
VTAPTIPDRAALLRPPSLTLAALAARTGIPLDTLRGWVYRGVNIPPAGRLTVAAAFRAYAAEVAAIADALEADGPPMR